MKLLPHHVRSPVGANHHRSGWPWVVSKLNQKLNDGKGLLLDDFTERSLVWNNGVHREPWIGMFHLPPMQIDREILHAFNRVNETFDRVLVRPNVQKSLRMMQGWITFSHETWTHLSSKLPDYAGIYLKLPTPNARLFDWSTFSMAPKVLQAGSFLKNTLLCEQFDCEWPKFVIQCEGDCSEQLRRTSIGQRPQCKYGPINLLRYDDQEYDNWLSSAVAVVEYFDLNASIFLLECLTRNTPVAINKHPAAEEYLGKDYPLFYDDYREIPGLLNMDCVYAAHRYLSEYPKDDLEWNVFVRMVSQFARHVQ